MPSASKNIPLEEAIANVVAVSSMFILNSPEKEGFKKELREQLGGIFKNVLPDACQCFLLANKTDMALLLKETLINSKLLSKRTSLSLHPASAARYFIKDTKTVKVEKMAYDFCDNIVNAKTASENQKLHRSHSINKLSPKHGDGRALGFSS